MTVYSDSRLCVDTLTLWAPNWERDGWRKSGGRPPENLELVRAAYKLWCERPHARLEWLKGHAGLRWNEYADCLANAWRFDS